MIYGALQKMAFMLCFSAAHDCLTNGDLHCAQLDALAVMRECPPREYFQNQMRIRGFKRATGKSSDINNNKKQKGEK